jgi:hypothetical protein
MRIGSLKVNIIELQSVHVRIIIVGFSAVYQNCIPGHQSIGSSPVVHIQASLFNTDHKDLRKVISADRIGVCTVIMSNLRDVKIQGFRSRQRRKKMSDGLPLYPRLLKQLNIKFHIPPYLTYTLISFSSHSTIFFFKDIL